MNGWLSFWTVFLVGSLALFAVLVLLVSVRGFTDIRALIAHQREKGPTSRSGS